MHICPYCASENIYFSKKNAYYICEDCDKRFDQPSIEKGMRIFISYGHDDNQQVVSMIKDYLVEKGYDVWIDTSCIQKGRDWRERITDGLVASNGVLAFLSKHSVRNPGVCLDELRIALRLKHSYVKSILLESDDKVKPPSHLTDRQWVDMKDWKSIPADRWEEYFQEKMSELLQALESTEAKKYEEDMECISNILGVYDTLSKEQSLLREEFIGREWLTQQLQDWFESDNNNRMILYGVPGSGKSAFVANFSNFSIDVIAGLFFSWDNTLLTDTDYVIRLLSYKLAASLNDYRRMLRDLLEKDAVEEKNEKNLHGDGLFDWLILDPINCCIDGFRGRRLIIFDGLDELNNETALLLFMKSAMFPEWICVLFTSRFDETAVSKYSSAKTLILNQYEERNTADILDYVSKRLNISAKDKRLSNIGEHIEGSFMYAKTLCDAIQNGQMDLQNTAELPTGLNEFYYEFFKRLFGEYDNYLKIRPFLELLCVEKDLSEIVLCLSLGMDRYTFWEMRSILRSLVIIDKGRWGERIPRFVHKSISDWLQSQDLAGDFFINVKNGYRTLISTCERLKENREKALEVIADLIDEDKVELQTAVLIAQFEELYPLCLTKAGQFEKYRVMLLQSFDKEEMDRKRNNHEASYTYYYYFYDLWRWADQFPTNDTLSDIRNKLKEIVTYPKTRMCSEFSHRSFQISALLFKELMITGRFSDVFFVFMEQLHYSAYFMSAASDMDGETRDGWDKYYMTRDVVCCLKSLDKLSIPVPDSVRNECERMKLTYCFYMGALKNSMFEKSKKEEMWSYGILGENELYKDICEYEPENEAMKERIIDYNTTSLRYYFIYGNDEDNDFVEKCVLHLADVKQAYQFAVKALESDKTLPGRANVDKATRLEYVHKAVKKYFD